MLREWQTRPREEIRALYEPELCPQVEQRMDDASGRAYMQTVSAYRDRQSGEVWLAVTVSRILMSRREAFLGLGIDVTVERCLHDPDQTEAGVPYRESP